MSSYTHVVYNHKEGFELEISIFSHAPRLRVYYVATIARLFIQNCFKGSDQREIGGSGVTSTLGTWYGGVVMGVLLSFNEAAIL